MNHRTLHRLSSRGKNHLSPFLLGAFVIVMLAGAGFLALPSRKAQAQRAEPTEKFRRMRNAIPGQYIVVLKDDQVMASRVDAAATELSGRFGGKLQITWQSAIRGFVIQEATESAAINVSKDPRVDYVMEDAKQQAFSAIQQPTPTPTPTTQSNTPSWGLDRIDQRDLLPLGNQYNYTNTGEGVRAYIIDSGIHFTHNDFLKDPQNPSLGSRAVLGVDFVGDGMSDCWLPFGHGTAIAGILGGRNYGVAKKVTLVSVRIADCGGGANVPDEDNATVFISRAVSGINWVVTDYFSRYPRIPSVANLSWNFSYTDTPGTPVAPINSAVKNLIAAGITCVVSAGNRQEDAALSSPSGQVEEAITVGASTISDAKATYSNHA